MANGSDTQAKSSSAIWDRLDSHGSRVSELAAAQAETKANLDSLARTVENGFSQINDALVRVAERDSKPTNWFAVISAAIVLGGAVLTFNALQTDPVRSRAIDNGARLNQLIEREMAYAEFHGRTTALLETSEHRLDQLEDWQHEANREFGRVDEISKRVEDIDNMGSRRWNGSDEPQ